MDGSPQPTATDLSSTDVRSDEGHGHRKGAVVGRGQGQGVNRGSEGGLRPEMPTPEGSSSGSRLAHFPRLKLSLRGLLGFVGVERMRQTRERCRHCIIGYIHLSISTLNIF